MVKLYWLGMDLLQLQKNPLLPDMGGKPVFQLFLFRIRSLSTLTRDLWFQRSLRISRWNATLEAFSSSMIIAAELFLEPLKVVHIGGPLFEAFFTFIKAEVRSAVAIVLLVGTGTIDLVFWSFGCDIAGWSFLELRWYYYLHECSLRIENGHAIHRRYFCQFPLISLEEKEWCPWVSRARNFGDNAADGCLSDGT